MRAALRIMSLPVVAGLLGSTALAADAGTQSPPTVMSQSRTVDLAVKVATITAGRLIIIGSTTRAGTDVAIANTSIHVKSDTTRLFRFDANYRTPDCVVDLKTQSGKLSVLVSDCAPQGIVPRGAWGPTWQYNPADVVFDGGSAWLAVRKNQGKRPALNSNEWQLFVAPRNGWRAGTSRAEGRQGSGWRSRTVRSRGSAGFPRYTRRRWRDWTRWSGWTSRSPRANGPGRTGAGCSRRLERCDPIFRKRSCGLRGFDLARPPGECREQAE